MSKWYWIKRDIQKWLKKCRYALLRKLFTDDEKYLIIRALHDRRENLERYKVTERYSFADNSDPYVDYAGVCEIFETECWS